MIRGTSQKQMEKRGPWKRNHETEVSELNFVTEFFEREL